MTCNFLGLRSFIVCLLILGFNSNALLSQKSLLGNINQPKTHVSAIGADKVTVDNVSGFNVNDTILLIQMQGVQILTAANYGTLQGKLGEPGRHEFMIIFSVNTGIREIVFRNNTLNTYDVNGNIQIIRTPYYNSVNITGKLFCDPWDPVTKSGGVLAMIVGRTISLTSDIDVSANGFKGGKDTIGDGICWNTNTVLYGKEYYGRSFRNAGYKGEGVANQTEFGQPLGSGYTRGLGSNWTGGGGANGRYSGGGGGSNRGAGGLGGLEDCFPPLPGGNGGLQADHPSLINRIYMGGGGGAATTSQTGTSSKGGEGGGIVIIVADAIVGNGGNILANGGDGGEETGIGGAGGGGAGGSIALSLNSYGTNALNFSVSGGNGGNNPGTFGEGGGGGGGLLYLSTNTTGNVTNFLNGGLAGNNPVSSASPGGFGEKRLEFKANLNGFLFNTISSSVTDNQVDSICSNMLPHKIIGTIPVGGTGPYTYLWEKSYDQSTWNPLTNDLDPTNFTPALVETATVWFRRTITDSSPTPLVDVSKSVRIIVQSFIKNNIVGNSDTICFAQDPPAFTSIATLQDGNGKYAFNWAVSLNNSTFTLPSNPHNAEGYTPPPALTLTSWYRRTVTSGRCIDSTAIVKITVLDTIKNNRILNSPPDICYGMPFANITATTTATTPALTGGDNAYIFKWESNINGVGWGTAPGVSDGSDYNPTELAQRIPSNQYIFRRVVYSGSNNVCTSTSNAILLKDYPVITNNNIAPVPAICSGSAPANIIGSNTPTLAGGNLIYTFSWQDSTQSNPTWTLISGATGADFQPPVLTDITGYRRIVNSSACSDVSISIKTIVHEPILNNNIAVLTGGVTQTICNNQVPALLQGSSPTGGTGLPGDFAYQWESSADNSVFTAISVGGTGISFQPPALTATTYYRRKAISGACTVNSNSITTTVLPLISNNILVGNTKVCYSLVPEIITGGTLSGGSGIYNYFWEQSTDNGTHWNAAVGTNNSSTYQPPALFNAIKYRRTVTSGLNNCCTDISPAFDIGIDPLPVSTVYAGSDTSIFSVEKIYHMKALSPLSGETGLWEVSGNGNSSITFDNNSGAETTVRNLAVGKNSFLWTISNGPCNLKDSVDIVLFQDFIPQGFSPNGDAWNNTFVIEGLNSDDQWVDLTIVNGAGTEVFKTSNRPPQKWTDWDGKNSNGLDLSEGTYYYMLKITSNPAKGGNGQVFKKSGFIVLKRY